MFSFGKKSVEQEVVLHDLSEDQLTQVAGGMCSNDHDWDDKKKKNDWDWDDKKKKHHHHHHHHHYMSSSNSSSSKS